MTQRDVKGTIDWYQANEVWPGEIGFDPDGMCQKICRTARNIGPGAASALAGALATPREFRVYDIRKVRRGSVMYFDDPNDSNPFGHIVTVVGRVKGADPDSLSSILTRTNSVKSNRIVVVRANFFPDNWGDRFQFSGEWINGVALDFPEAKKKPKPKPLLPERGRKRLERMLDLYDEMIENHKGDERVVRALRRDKKEIRETIKRKVA